MKAVILAAIKEGKFRSWSEHYEIHGERVGRMFRRLFGITSREEKVLHLLDKKGWV